MSRPPPPRPAWDGHLAATEAAERAQLISDVRYQVALDLAQTDGEFRCDTTIRFHANAGNMLTFLDFAGTPESIECNGAAVGAAAHHGARIYLPVVIGENEVRIAGTGRYGRSGAGLHRFRDPVDGQVYLHTKFAYFHAHRVYPCFDQPDIRAALELTATADDRWQVIANTEPIGPPARRPDGQAVWSFRRTPPLPPYLTVLVAGPFQRISASRGGIPLTLYARAALAEEVNSAAAELFELQRRGLDHCAELLGRPYPFGKQDQVFAPESAAWAIGYPGCVVCDERLLFRGRATGEDRRRRAGTMLRAVARLWFGGLVGIRWWDELWLTEGMATLLAAYAQPRVTPFDQPWTHFELESGAAARDADRRPGAPPIAGAVPDTDALRRDIEPIVADKAAAVLRQLAEQLGWPEFLAGLRRFLHEHAWSTAGLEELIRALEPNGKPKLITWAEDWLRRPGINTVEVDRLPSGPAAVHLSDPPEEARSIWLRTGCYARRGDELARYHGITVELDRPGSREHPKIGARRACDLVLPNDDGHSYLKVRLDPVSRRALLRRISAVTDPVARVLAWGALWDDVIEGRLPARAFAATVLAHAPAEPDDGVLLRLWDRALAAAQSLGAQSNRVPLLRSLGQRIRTELDGAPVGCDRQLTLARALTGVAADEFGVLVDLARGRPTWPGLVVDRDLRWRALLRLAERGQRTGALVAAALSADPGDEGRRRTLTIEAAQPDSRAKEQAWRRVFRDTHSLAERQAIMSGFRRPGQEAVLTPFAERYFAAMEHGWESLGPDDALAVARALYPLISNAEQEVLARTDELLERDRLPESLMRVLRDQRAELALAVAARARDTAG